MKRMGEIFEICVYTASLSKYADPLLDELDVHNVIRWRLFREHCVYHEGHYVKDLSILGRPLEHSIIVDNSPMSYMFQPSNAVPILSFIDDKSDRELIKLSPLFERLAEATDVRQLLSQFHS